MTLEERIDELAEKMYALEGQSWTMQSVIERVNRETNEMRFAGAVPADIRSRVGRIAKENGVDEKELEKKECEIFECERKLKHAVWNLVKPFEEKKRAIDNEREELEWELNALEELERRNKVAHDRRVLI